MTRGAATMESWTAGDYGGAFAGFVAALAALGKGLAWLLNWQGAREERRAKRLAEWEASLTRREQEQREDLEDKFAAIARQVATGEGKTAVLAGALIEVTAELRIHAPQSPALARSSAALRMAFPMEHDFEALLAQLDTREERGDAK